MYIETSFPRASGDNAMLVSPMYNNTLQICSFNFWYHMYGNTVGALNVYINQTGSPLVKVWSKSGDRGNRWHVARAPVGRFLGTFQVCFCPLNCICTWLSFFIIPFYIRELLHVLYLAQCCDAKHGWCVLCLSDRVWRSCRQQLHWWHWPGWHLVQLRLLLCRYVCHAVAVYLHLNRYAFLCSCLNVHFNVH